MLKFTIQFCLSILTISGFSQSKEFFVVDAETKQPIDLAQAYYPDLEIGSVSNADGKIKIPLHQNALVVTHINYKDATFDYEFLTSNDTLSLKLQTNELQEVLIFNVDLKQKFKDVLKNYLDNYSSRKITHHATFKEQFKVNDTLARLFQVQLNLFSKYDLFNFNADIDKQFAINLVSVDYSKKKDIDKNLTNANAAHIEIEDLLMFSQLNFNLSQLINLTQDYEILSIEKIENDYYVYFNATTLQDGEILYKHKNSLVVFDEDYSAIKYCKFNTIYETDFEVDISKKSKKSYKRKTTRAISEHAFNKLKNNKYSIAYFNLEIDAIIKTELFEDNVSSVISLFVNQSEFGKKLKDKPIDLSKPFYDNVPEQSDLKDVKILLTKAEQDFLND
jgi:hypothetical protein